MNEDYFFFWGGECSQWTESTFEEFGITFNCAEQFMMAAKAKVFNDDDSYHAIMGTVMPNEQKALGKKVKGFVKETWDAISRDYVTLGNINKFQQNSELLTFLKENKDKHFVEASPYDKIWGIGLGENDPTIHDPKNWKGLNWLGECINNTATLLFPENEVVERLNQKGIEELRERLNWFK